MNNKLLAIVYFVTSGIGALAAAGETRIGMIAAYVLFAGSVLAFFSTTVWSVWLPFVASAVLAVCFIPSEVRNLALYPRAIFSDSTTVAVHAVLVGLLLFSLVLATRRLIKFYDRSRLNA